MENQELMVNEGEMNVAEVVVPNVAGKALITAGLIALTGGVFAAVKYVVIPALKKAKEVKKEKDDAAWLKRIESVGEDDSE